MKALLLGIALAASFANATRAQEIAGDWQGTLKSNAGAAERVILHITKHGNCDLTAMVFWVNRLPDGFGVNELTLRDSDLRFTIFPFQIVFAGKLSADGSSIHGTWTDDKTVVPVEFQRATKETAWRHPPPETISFIPVERNGRLEVIDWGGTGRPLVLLAGLGNTAHIFENFAPKLTSSYHVYGITRRGFGESNSSAPTQENYSADRLADDDLAVIAALKLDHPVLAGHSIAGEELSSIGTRFPNTIAGLIYLDAGFSQSLWDPQTGDPQIDANDVQRELDQLALSGGTPQQRKQVVQELLKTSLPLLEKDLQIQMKELQQVPDLPATTTASWEPRTRWPAAQAVLQGMQKYTDIRSPVLAIFAVPHNLGPNASDAAKSKDLAETTAHADLFQNRVPGVTVIRIAGASHDIFRSNEAEVLRAMKTFIAGLRPPESSNR
jgi:non-heme chloroperoxidase